MRRTPPVRGYVIQRGELELPGNIWLDCVVLWVEFISIHALPCDAAACVESWSKQQDVLFLLARISAQDVGFLLELDINVWAESS